MNGERRVRQQARRRKFLRWLLLIGIGLFLGLRLYWWNANRIAGNAMPMPFGYGVSVVLSGSMEPTLSTNDLVIIHQQDSYEIQDVVVYQVGTELIIHRMIEQSGDWVRTQGDANNTPDSPIPVTAIKGKLVVRIPWVGMVIRALKTPLGVCLTLVLAFFLLELSYRREKKQDASQLEEIQNEIKKLRSGQDRSEDQ